MKNDSLLELFGSIIGRDWKRLLLNATDNGWIQLFRYCFVGGGAFFIDFGVYCILGWIGIPYLAAGVISFIAGFAFNFGISRMMIFQSTASARIDTRELVSVLMISLIGLIFTEILLYSGTELLHFDYRVAKIAASILVLFWNYAARKVFVYK